MAVMNTAYRLIAKGKTVFLMDFDLEAPGMDSFFPGQNKDGPGIVEYISAYLDRGEVPSLRDFVVEVPLTGSGPGRLFCMRAGSRDANYQTLLARLNWKDFYARGDGFLFVENLKGAIEADYSPDYLLVDSRTGLTDISGICTLQLPNLVVLMFSLNEQSIEGIKTIYTSITRNKLNRPIETMLIASPVPDVPEFVDLKEKRLLRASRSLGRDVDLILPYAGFVAFEEVILPHGDAADTYLAYQYGELADRVVAANTSDVLTLLKQARKLGESGDLEHADEKFREITEAHRMDPRAWRGYGMFLRTTRQPEKALDAFERALQLGGHEINRADLATTHLVLGNEGLAQQEFEQFLRLSRNEREIARFADFFAQRGRVLMAIAGYKRLAALVSEQRRLIHVLVALGNFYIRIGEPENALQYFQEVLRIEPSNLPSTYNMGHALGSLGRAEEARSYFEAAIAISKQTPTEVFVPASRANIAQAMGRAYSALGLIDEARESYLTALQLAEGLGKTPIFSAVSYREILAEEFTAETRYLLERLGK
jgi:tetratricopeptide (TPR) repeat protein